MLDFVRTTTAVLVNAYSYCCFPLPTPSLVAPDDEGVSCTLVGGCSPVPFMERAPITPTAMPTSAAISRADCPKGPGVPMYMPSCETRAPNWICHPHATRRDKAPLQRGPQARAEHAPHTRTCRNNDATPRSSSHPSRASTICGARRWAYDTVVSAPAMLTDMHSMMKPPYEPTSPHSVHAFENRSWVPLRRAVLLVGAAGGTSAPRLVRPRCRITHVFCTLRRVTTWCTAWRYVYPQWWLPCTACNAGRWADSGASDVVVIANACVTVNSWPKVFINHRH